MFNHRGRKRLVIAPLTVILAQFTLVLFFWWFTARRGIPESNEASQQATRASKATKISLKKLKFPKRPKIPRFCHFGNFPRANFLSQMLKKNPQIWEKSQKLAALLGDRKFGKSAHLCNPRYVCATYKSFSKAKICKVKFCVDVTCKQAKPPWKYYSSF